MKGYIVYGMLRRSSSFNTGRIEHLYRGRHAKSVRCVITAFTTNPTFIPPNECRVWGVYVAPIANSLDAACGCRVIACLNPTNLISPTQHTPHTPC
jgi:hypothetical protein